MTKQDLVIKTFKIREDIADEIERLAAKLDISQAAVVRFILSDYFDKNNTVTFSNK